jgi:hypothetical protein
MTAWFSSPLVSYAGKTRHSTLARSTVSDRTCLNRSGKSAKVVSVPLNPCTNTTKSKSSPDVLELALEATEGLELFDLVEGVGDLESERVGDLETEGAGDLEEDGAEAHGLLLSRWSFIVKSFQSIHHLGDIGHDLVHS